LAIDYLLQHDCTLGGCRPPYVGFMVRMMFSQPLPMDSSFGKAIFQFELDCEEFSQDSVMRKLTNTLLQNFQRLLVTATLNQSIRPCPK
jgi:uncharacterized protein (DUF2344 family)